MASRRASAVPRTVQLPGQEKKLPKLALYFLTASIDIVCSKVVGVVPAPGVQFIRSAVIFLLYREWVLALVCGFFLPAMVPLTVICCLKRSWAAFRTNALAAVDKERARMAAASGPPRSAGVPQHHTAHTAHTAQSGQATQGGGRGDRPRPPGETSGYDVSAVSGEEVVELTSWAASTASGGSCPRARR